MTDERDGQGVTPECHAPRDPHGEAALLLVESLIHALRARRTLTVRDAIDVVEDALDISIASHDDRGDDGRANQGARHLLASIAASLRIDRR